MNISYAAVLLCCIVSIMIAVPLVASAQSDLMLVVRDRADGVNVLHWGFQIGATSGLDRDLGEEEFPPAPPEFLFEARWIDPRAEQRLGQGSKVDFRDPGTMRDSFRLRVQTALENYPVTVAWPALGDEIASAEIRYIDADGNAIVHDMKTEQLLSCANTEMVSNILIVVELQGDETIIPGMNVPGIIDRKR